MTKRGKSHEDLCLFFLLVGLFSAFPAIAAPKVKSVTFNPATVTGGASSDGTVTLTAPAPANGFFVVLSSSTSAVRVPKNVLVASGHSSATFDANTSAVQQQQKATITAAGVDGTLIIKPAAMRVSAVVLSPGSLVGGNSATGTVVLSSPAPRGGAIVSLLSSNLVADVDPVVVVPSGSTSATFPITTLVVASATLATVTANLGISSSTADLSVLTAPSSAEVQLTVNTANKHQKWLAWRATATGPTFQGHSGDLSNTPLLNEILNDVVDLGINGYRIELFASTLGPGPSYDFSKKDPVIQQIVLATQKRVKNNGEPFSTYVTVIGGFPKNWPWANDPAEYGNMAAAFLSHYSSSGSGISFTPTYWVTVNEPSSNGFTCCSGPGNEVQFQNALANQLRALGSAVQLELPDTSSPSSGYTIGDFAALTSPSQAGLIAWHGYDYGRSGVPPSFTERNKILSFALSKAVSTAATEICCGADWNGSYVPISKAPGSGEPLGWARDIFWNMTEGDISVWEPLAVMYTCGQIAGCPNGGQDPIVLEPDLKSYHKYQAYYALRQFAHYIRPNATRVDITCANCVNDVHGSVGQNVKPVAWLSPANKLVLVVVNDQTVTQTISIDGLPASRSFTVTGVDPLSATNQSLGSLTTDRKGTLKMAFPAQAIVTFTEN